MAVVCYETIAQFHRRTSTHNLYRGSFGVGGRARSSARAVVGRGGGGGRAELLENPQGRIGFADYHLLASCALSRSEEPALRLLLGQRLSFSTHGILGYVALSSANLDKAIQLALKY